MNSDRNRLRTPVGLLCGLALALVAACSGGGDGDEAEAVCWHGGGTPSPGIELEIGVGAEQFEPLEADEEVILYAGAQGGGHFFLNALARGIAPGEPRNPRPGNPTTLFQIHFEDGENVSAHDCAFPYGYEPAAEAGAYQLPGGRLVAINRRYFPQIYSQRVRLTAEVLTADGDYGFAETFIITGLDPSLPVDAGPPDAGTPDAGPRDAGPQDAASLNRH